MSLSSYHALTLEWSPESSYDRHFTLIAAVMIVVMIGLGILLSSIQLPKAERKARQEIPERIANLLLEKKKPQPKITKPEVKPVKKPKPKKKADAPKPNIKKPKIRKTEKKTLTQAEKTAREKAEKSGLIALKGQLADLMETTDITAMVSGSIRATAAVNTAANADTGLLMADVGKGSGGVAVGNTVFKSKVVSKTELATLDQVKVEQKLISKGKTLPAASSEKENRKGRPGVRAEEEVTLVFDKNKGVLYSLYNRARRKNPGLKGKIILSITIAPSGKVTGLKIVTTELNDKTLEARLLKRIRNFDFGAREVAPVTVTYPIEFLPS